MSARFRVLHILGELRPSGAECMLVAAAQEFIKHGVRGDILSTGETVGPFSAELNAAGYQIHHIPFSRSVRFFRVLRHLIRGHYDVVHVHTERASFWVALTAIGSGAPVVVRTIHSSFAFAGSLRLRRSMQRRTLRLLGVRHVAVGRSVQETEKRRFGLTTQVIHNWYDSRRFRVSDAEVRRQARAALGISDRDLVIATVGNCAPVKNHVAVLEAIASVPAEVRPLYLHVGIEEGGHGERELAQKLGVAKRIRFLGHLKDVREALHAADAFVMPSLCEGFAVAAIEATAMGLPLIASDVSGLRDLRSDFRGILYVDPNAKSLSEALLAFIALSTEDRRSLSQDYPAIARERYGIETGVRNYIEVYASK